MTASALTAGLTGAASGQGKPVSIYIAAPNTPIPSTQSAGFGTDVVTSVNLDTIHIEESGSHDGVHADFEITDLEAAYSAIRGEWPVLITKNTTTGKDVLFLGFVRQSRGKYQAKYGGKVVSAVDFSSLLDRDVVKYPFKINSGINTKDAIQRCFATMTLVYEYLGGAGLDWSNVRTDLGEDGTGVLQDTLKFSVGTTLRQCVEQILGNVSATANYRMDFVPRLWTWDAQTLDAALLDAPYDIHVAHTLSAGEVAPEDFEHEWNTEQRISAVVIDGKKSAGSGVFADQDRLPDYLLGDQIDKFGGRILPGPWSAELFGMSHAALAGQPSTEIRQAIRLARAALIDLRNPIPMGSFSVKETSCYNGSTRWAGGQLVYVTADAYGLTGRNPDPGPWAGQADGTTPGTRWAVQPFRISRVTTEFVNGAGDLKQTIEYGGRRQHLSRV